jgi:hypothetical protein
LKAVQVLEGGKLVPKKKGITLRMLLSHTGQFLLYAFQRKRVEADIIQLASVIRSSMNA